MKKGPIMYTKGFCHPKSNNLHEHIPGVPQHSAPHGAHL